MLSMHGVPNTIGIQLETTRIMLMYRYVRVYVVAGSEQPAMRVGLNVEQVGVDVVKTTGKAELKKIFEKVLNQQNLNTDAEFSSVEPVLAKYQEGAKESTKESSDAKKKAKEMAADVTEECKESKLLKNFSQIYWKDILVNNNSVDKLIDAECHPAILETCCVALLNALFFWMMTQSSTALFGTSGKRRLRRLLLCGLSRLSRSRSAIMTRAVCTRRNLSFRTRLWPQSSTLSSYVASAMHSKMSKMRSVGSYE